MTLRPVHLAFLLAACGSSVDVPLQITLQPVSQTVTEPAGASFSVAATSSTEISFQWRRNGQVIPGAIQATYALATTTNAGDDGALFDVIVHDRSDQEISAAATLTVQAQGTVTVASITSQPTSLIGVVNQPATLSVAATAPAAMTYQWSKDGTAIAGATKASLDIASLSLADAGSYTVTVSSGGNDTLSDAATIVVITDLTDLMVTAGQPASLLVQAAGSPAPSFQWYRGTPAQPIAGATSATYAIASASSADDDSYYVVATNPSGSAQTQAAVLTVTAVNNAPTITHQPTGVQVTVGHATSLSVTATGTGPLAYQWYRYVNGVTDTPVGTNSATYPIASAVNGDAGNYYVIVSNGSGTVQSQQGGVSVYAKGVVTQFAYSTSYYDSVVGQTTRTITTAYKHDLVDVAVSFTGENITIGCDAPAWTPIHLNFGQASYPLVSDVNQPEYTFTVGVANAINDVDTYTFHLPVSTSGWTATAHMLTVPRAGHSATLLADGTVLIAGGIAAQDGSNALASAEIYDPATDTFTAVGNMLTGRTRHTATLLPGGRVLIAGGVPKNTFSLATAVATAELYDPVQKTFTAVAQNPAHARVGHTATPLADGTVLLAGGTTAIQTDINLWASAAAITQAELFDPVMNKFTTVASAMADANVAGFAVVLSDGRVLLGGGNLYTDSSSGPGFGDVYDPAAKTFTRASTNLKYHMGGRSAALMADGGVLVTEGEADGFFSGAPLSDMEVFAETANDPLATGYPGTFAPFLPEWNSYNSRAFATLSLLSDHTLIFAGGNVGSYGIDPYALRYDPSTLLWTSRNYLTETQPRELHTATWLPSVNRLLVVGGYSGNGAASNQGAELFTP